jgi:hypothetical protein
VNGFNKGDKTMNTTTRSAFKKLLPLAAFAASVLAALAGCMTPSERHETREKGRVEGRTQERQEQRRGS